jgi:autotransporter-associated beta strand protein
MKPTDDTMRRSRFPLGSIKQRGRLAGVLLAVAVGAVASSRGATYEWQGDNTVSDITAWADTNNWNGDLGYPIAGDIAWFGVPDLAGSGNTWENVTIPIMTNVVDLTADAAVGNSATGSPSGRSVYFSSVGGVTNWSVQSSNGSGVQFNDGDATLNDAINAQIGSVIDGTTNPPVTVNLNVPVLGGGDRPAWQINQNSVLNLNNTYNSRAIFYCNQGTPTTVGTVNINQPDCTITTQDMVVGGNQGGTAATVAWRTALTVNINANQTNFGSVFVSWSIGPGDGVTSFGTNSIVIRNGALLNQRTANLALGGNAVSSSTCEGWGRLQVGDQSTTGVLTMQSSRSLVMGNSSGTGILDIDNGIVTLLGAGQSVNLPAGNFPVCQGIINLATNGTLDTMRNFVYGPGKTGLGLFNFNGGRLVVSGGSTSTMITSGLFSAGETVMVNDGGARIDTAGFSAAINTPLLAGDGGVDGTDGGLTKSGANELILAAANTYTGPSTVSNGTLRVNGSIGTNQVTVVSGAIGGGGAIGGNVTVGADGATAPGAAGTETLTVNGNFTSAGDYIFVVDKSLFPTSSSLSVDGTLNQTAAGTLTVAGLDINSLKAVTVGDTFQLFNKPLPGGSQLSVVSDYGITWSNRLELDGSVVVLTGPVVPAPANVTSSVTGNKLVLDWPAGQGWQLQAQTNSLDFGIMPEDWNWFDVTGVTQPPYTNTINPANPTVFYRLKY